jgi:hypothetical protein
MFRLHTPFEINIREKLAGPFVPRIAASVVDHTESQS